MRYVGLIFGIPITLYTESSSNIHPGNPALECQNSPPPETRTLGNLMPQYLHGNHRDSQNRWREHQPWPS